MDCRWLHARQCFFSCRGSRSLFLAGCLRAEESTSLPARTRNALSRLPRTSGDVQVARGLVQQQHGGRYCCGRHPLLQPPASAAVSTRPHAWLPRRSEGIATTAHAVEARLAQLRGIGSGDTRAAAQAAAAEAASAIGSFQVRVCARVGLTPPATTWSVCVVLHRSHVHAAPPTAPHQPAVRRCCHPALAHPTTLACSR
jgi:hypothetical protein